MMRVTSSLILFSILPWGQTGLPAEYRGEIALVTETQQRCDLRDSPIRGGQKLFSRLNAFPDQVFPHGQADVPFKKMAEMIGAETHGCSNILGVDLLRQMVGYIVLCLLHVDIAAVPVFRYPHHFAEPERRVAHKYRDLRQACWAAGAKISR